MRSEVKRPRVNPAVEALVPRENPAGFPNIAEAAASGLIPVGVPRDTFRFLYLAQKHGATAHITPEVERALDEFYGVPYSKMVDLQEVLGTRIQYTVSSRLAEGFRVLQKHLPPAIQQEYSAEKVEELAYSRKTKASRKPEKFDPNEDPSDPNSTVVYRAPDTTFKYVGIEGLAGDDTKEVKAAWDAYRAQDPDTPLEQRDFRYVNDYDRDLIAQVGYKLKIIVEQGKMTMVEMDLILAALAVRSTVPKLPRGLLNKLEAALKD